MATNSWDIVYFRSMQGAKINDLASSVEALLNKNGAGPASWHVDRDVQTKGGLTSTELEWAWKRNMGSQSEPTRAARDAKDVGFLCHGCQMCIIPYTGNDFAAVKNSKGEVRRVG